MNSDTVSNLKKSCYGAGKMAQLVKCWPHKHEELSCIPKIHEKGLGRWQGLEPQQGGSRDRRSMGAYWPAS